MQMKHDGEEDEECAKLLSSDPQNVDAQPEYAIAPPFLQITPCNLCQLVLFPSPRDHTSSFLVRGTPASSMQAELVGRG